VVLAEYKTWYITSDSSIYSFNNWSRNPVIYPIGGRKAVMGVGGFNFFRIIDDQGYVWTSKIDLSTNSVRTNTDSTGAPFDGNVYVDAYADAAATIRSDGSIWYFGKDTYSFFYPGGNPGTSQEGRVMVPTQLSPPGIRFKKIQFGGFRLLALSTKGIVYQWTAGGGRIPTLMPTPLPALDIFASHLDLAGCIIPATRGAKMGYPYIWGTTTSMYGGEGGPPYTVPTSIKALWKMTVPVKEICADWNTIHYIDSLGRLFGIGFNSMGEVGNGQEFVNKYNYPGFPGYGWTFTDYENPSGAPPTQIGVGITWKHLYSNNWFSFYKYAQDVNDNLYSWGRNKALNLGNGFFNMQEANSYDALDVLKPTMVHPLTAIYQQYNFTAPSISVDPKQTITGSSAVLDAKVTPPLLIKNTPVAANGIDTIRYRILSYKWSKIKGAQAKISDPGSHRTTVSQLIRGTYVFNLTTRDSNTGTLSANVIITVISDKSSINEKPSPP
jgi:hypothetical protein